MKVLYSLIILAALAIAGAAQTTVSANFVNASNEGYESNRGLNLAVQQAVYKYEGVKLEGVFDFTAYLKGEKAYVYTLGPQASVDLLGNRLTPFARVLFGVTRYDKESYYTYSYGGGLDVNLSDNLYVRPFQYDRQVVDAHGVSASVHRIGVGIGLRFGKSSYAHPAPTPVPSATKR